MRIVYSTASARDTPRRPTRHNQRYAVATELFLRPFSEKLNDFHVRCTFQRVGLLET